MVEISPYLIFSGLSFLKFINEIFWPYISDICILFIFDYTTIIITIIVVLFFSVIKILIFRHFSFIRFYALSCKGVLPSYDQVEIWIMKSHVGSLSGLRILKKVFIYHVKNFQNIVFKINLGMYIAVAAIERNWKCKFIAIKGLKNKMIINWH